MSATTPVTGDVYYDPYDVTINADPYPTYKRLREEAPIYYNDRFDVWAARAAMYSVCAKPSSLAICAICCSSSPDT